MKRSQKFIESVRRNLPPPERSGPRTREGKNKIKYNALKHGLNVNGLLPCKPEYCIYRQHTCTLHEHQLFAGICLIELNMYIYLKEQIYRRYKNIDPDLIEAYILYTIQIERANRYIAINPDILWNGHFYKMLLRMHKKLISVTKKIIKEEDKNDR